MSQSDGSIDMSETGSSYIEGSDNSAVEDKATEAVVDTKATTKTTAAKKSTRGRKPVKKDGDPKSPIVLVKPIEMQKKFTPNTVVNYCNSYFGNLYDHAITFNKLSDEKDTKKTTTKSKQLIMDLTSIPAIDRIRKIIEGMDLDDLKLKAGEYRSFDRAESEKLASLIHAPYFHTTLCYACEKKLDMDRFAALCAEFDIQPVEQIGLVKTISDLAAFAGNELRVVPRAFNSVFGAHYQQLHPDKQEVHKRYLQHAPEGIMEILDAKEAEFEKPNKEMYAKFLSSYVKKLTPSQKKLNTELGTNSLQKVLLKREDNIFKNNTIDKLCKMEEFKGASKEDVTAIANTYQKMAAVANFIDYLSEIKDAKFYSDKLAEVKAICDEFNKASDEIEAIHAEAMGIKDVAAQWPLLLKSLVILTKVYRHFSSDKKKPSTVLLTHLRKAKINVNIKSDKLKKAIESLADNEATDAKIKEIADANDGALAQLSISKTYDPTQTDIYEKIGNYIYSRWNTRKDIPRINKNVRIAIGITLFMYICEQVKILSAGRKQTNIAMKF